MFKVNSGSLIVPAALAIGTTNYLANSISKPLKRSASCPSRLNFNLDFKSMPANDEFISTKKIKKKKNKKKKPTFLKVERTRLEAQLRGEKFDTPHPSTFEYFPLK